MIQFSPSSAVVRPFALANWHVLEELNASHLAEHGISIDPANFTDGPEDSPPGSPEWDLDHITEVYLGGLGGFWIAWVGETAAGHVGAQDVGGGIELRRMYVRSEYRRKGIGTQLVSTLVAHCRANGVAAIEVWTRFDGPGRHLYRGLGFRQVTDRGRKFKHASVRDEMRMRLDL